MKSWMMRAEADSATLELQDVTVPEPGPGQVRIAVRAAGLNRGEFIVGHGLAKAGTVKPAGMEAAGTIDAIGAGVAGLKVGDRVMGRCAGAFSPVAIMDAREAIAVPTSLSWEQAAAVPLAFLVVHDMLFAQGRLVAGEWVLVAGVTSGVGVAALQSAKAAGARVIGTSGSAEKLGRLKAEGLDVALRTRSPDFHDAVMQATAGKGVDLVVNTLGGTVFAECVRSMGFQARFAMVGYVDGVLRAELDLQALHARRLTFFGVSNKQRNADQRAAGLPAFVRDIVPALADGRIRPVVDRVFAFGELPEARAHMEANRHLGKIVVAIP
ncbi:MAG TPA: zinc-binding dehydrogenase [Usitatibacteraceae bacterium]|nr:zinc-binding dehydrogenase [Usitatibacteraceae bacterium]